MNKGYIKLWRTSFDNEFYFAEPFTKWQAWVDLLMLANHKTRTVSVRGIMVEVCAGQVMAGEEFLKSRWKWSRGKVRKFIQQLASENRQQIVLQKNNVCSMITVLNWDTYQGCNTTDSTTESTTDSTSNCTTERQQKDIPKNVENDKKKIDTVFFENFWSLYPRKVAKKAAMKAFEKVKSNQDVVLSRLKNTITTEWAGKEIRFIPHPATWLNGERWEDELFSDIPARVEDWSQHCSNWKGQAVNKDGLTYSEFKAKHNL